MSDIILILVSWGIVLSYPLICAAVNERAESKSREEVEGWE